MIFVRIFSNTFEYTVTGKIYNTNGNLCCNSHNVKYLITCSSCNIQYIGSAFNFKDRFRLHKSDIKTGKLRCGAAKHFINFCTTPGKFDYLRV